MCQVCKRPVVCTEEPRSQKTSSVSVALSAGGNISEETSSHTDNHSGAHNISDFSLNLELKSKREPFYSFMYYTHIINVFLFSHSSSHLQPFLRSVPSPVLYDTAPCCLPRQPKLPRQSPGCVRESADSAAVFRSHGTRGTHHTTGPHSPGGRLHHPGRTGTVPGTLYTMLRDTTLHHAGTF